MKTTIIFDPLNAAHPDCGPGDILEGCGTLPEWVTAPEHAKLPLREALELQYPFELFELRGAALTEDLRLTYPGDPPLAPLLIIERNSTETFIQYHYGLVCLRTPSGDFFTRMD